MRIEIHLFIAKFLVFHFNSFTILDLVESGATWLLWDYLLLWLPPLVDATSTTHALGLAVLLTALYCSIVAACTTGFISLSESVSRGSCFGTLPASLEGFECLRVHGCRGLTARAG